MFCFGLILCTATQGR